MKVALVRPNHPSYVITPPLGIGYLSSYLKRHGHEVGIVDALNAGLSLEEVLHECRTFDLVGISALSTFILEASSLSRALKEKGHTIVLGGPHPSFLPKDTLECSGADFVVAGEGERALLHIADSLDAGMSPGNYPGLISSPGDPPSRSTPIEDLDSLPFPDWKQMDPRRYGKAPHGSIVREFPLASMVTSRGCSFGCKFCSSPSLWGRRVRFRSPENVADELEYLAGDFGVREIHFEDDNITLKREHMEKICELIINRNLRLSWALITGIRVESVDRDLLRLMKKSGCYYISFGIESGDQDILDGIDKKTDLATIERAVTMARREGIMTQGSFILGLPGENADTIEKTVKFALKIPLDRAVFFHYDVLPGSAFWEEIAIRGGWKPRFEARSFHETTWIPPGMTAEQMREARSSAFRRFYLRPRQLLGLLGSVRNIRLSQIGAILDRLRDYSFIR
jgi:radical SAM superfamily enzyme YgiQ (UPF0313 family)